MAVFGGLALIAAAIYFGPGSHSATAQSGGVQKMVICDESGTKCAGIVKLRGRKKVNAAAVASFASR